jgi:hypothetical protein
MTAIPDPSQTQTPNPFPRATAFWICALLVGIGISAASVYQDRGNRHELEKVIQRTSVEDKNYFPFADRDLIRLRYDGSRLVYSGTSSVPMPDSRMIFEGETEEPKYRLYIPVERLNGESQLGGPSWYLKTAPGQFMKVTR